MTDTVAALSNLIGLELAHHPRLALAYTLAWLDPLYDNSLVGYDDYDESPEYSASEALDYMRMLFPVEYQRLLNDAQQGRPITDADVLDAFERCMRQQYPFIPIEEFVDAFGMMGGIPVPFWGFVVTDHGFITPDELKPEWYDFYRLFGLKTRPHRYEEGRIFDDDEWSFAIQTLVKPLLHHCVHQVTRCGDSQPFTDLCFLLMRAFMISGNSSVDVSYQEYLEDGWQPMDWDPENVAYINDIGAEAFLIVQAADRALEYLNTHPDFRSALQRNIRTIKRTLKKGAPLSHGHFEWPNRGCERGRFSDPPRRNTPAHTSVLFLRGSTIPSRFKHGAFDPVPRES